MMMTGRNPFGFLLAAFAVTGFTLAALTMLHKNGCCGRSKPSSPEPS
jgi:hypothetical protein